MDKEYRRQLGARLGKSNIGRHRSEETKQRMSEGQRMRRAKEKAAVTERDRLNNLMPLERRRGQLRALLSHKRTRDYMYGLSSVSRSDLALLLDGLEAIRDTSSGDWAKCILVKLIAWAEVAFDLVPDGRLMGP